MATAVQQDSVHPLDELLNTLDRQAATVENGAADSSEAYWANHRRHPRFPFRCECTVRFLGGPPIQLSALPGRTRNLSRGGAGLLVKRSFTAGDMIEIQLHRNSNNAPNYLAGEVRFCRYAGAGYYEVGMQLKIAAKEAIFSSDTALLITTIESLRKTQAPE